MPRILGAEHMPSDSLLLYRQVAEQAGNGNSGEVVE